MDAFFAANVNLVNDVKLGSAISTTDLHHFAPLCSILLALTHQSMDTKLKGTGDGRWKPEDGGTPPGKSSASDQTSPADCSPTSVLCFLTVCFLLSGFRFVFRPLRPSTDTNRQQ